LSFLQLHDIYPTEQLLEQDPPIHAQIPLLTVEFRASFCLVKCEWVTLLL
jgi:hypothetical protein